MVQRFRGKKSVLELGWRVGGAGGGGGAMYKGFYVLQANINIIEFCL